MSTAVMVAAAGAEDDEGLTAAIRREHEAASTAAQSAIEHALECGRLLAQARADIRYGAWESFVREHCGIAPRTARLYLQLDARRDRIANRQHVAGLTLREAARLVAEPKAKAPPQAEAEPVVQAEPSPGRDVADEAEDVSLFGPVPSWYRPGVECNGFHHTTKWFFQVWPHPQGEPWVHLIVWVPSGTGSWSHGEGPKRGIHVGALGRYLHDSIFHGMPRMDDEAWDFWHDPAATVEAASSKHYNAILFADEEHYRVHGLGLQPSRKRRRKAGLGASE